MNYCLLLFLGVVFHLNWWNDDDGRRRRRKSFDKKGYITKELYILYTHTHTRKEGEKERENKEKSHIRSTAHKGDVHPLGTMYLMNIYSRSSSNSKGIECYFSPPSFSSGVSTTNR